MNTIYGNPPSNNMDKDNEWFDIPNFNGRYQINKEKQIRAFYKYKGHYFEPHFKLLKQNGNRVELKGIKYNLDIIYESIFGEYSISDLPNERWKPLVDFEGYNISNHGRVKRNRIILKRSNGVSQFMKEQLIKPSYINTGYKIINLHKNKELFHFLIHRLVALYFIPNPNNYSFVNHKDENKINNHYSNLEWCTYEYNCNYGTAQQRRVERRKQNNNGEY